MSEECNVVYDCMAYRFIGRTQIVNCMILEWHLVGEGVNGMPSLVCAEARYN